MKTRLLSLLVPVLALSFAGALFTSCSDDNDGAYYINEFYDKIQRNEWGWNADLERFELFFKNPNIDRYMYEQGITDGYVWIYEDEVEVRKQLEYTYSAEYNGDWFDATISYDISPGEIGLFVRFPFGNDYNSNYLRGAIPSPLDFKISLMWLR